MAAIIVIILVLAVIMLIPLGARVRYNSEGLSVWASVWLYKLKVLPRGKKSPEPLTEESANEVKPRRKRSVFGGFAADDWLSLAKTGLKALRRLKNGVCFDNISLKCIISAGDPYAAVTRYNAVNGAAGSFIPFFEAEFKVKRKDVLIDLDTAAGKSLLELDISASLKVGTLLALAIAAGFGFLKLLICVRIRQKRERTVDSGEQQINRDDAIDDEEHQRSC